MCDRDLRRLLVPVNVAQIVTLSVLFPWDGCKGVNAMVFLVG